MPTIAIDYTAAYEQGAGIGRLVRHLIGALAEVPSPHNYRLFVAGATTSDLPEPPGLSCVWKPTRLSPRWLFRIWHRLRLPLPVEVFTGRVDLYHSTDFVLPPHLPATPTIVTVHDLSFVRVPQAAPPRLKAYLDVVVPRSARRADHIVADSAATKADLIELYGLPEEKITVLLSGVDSRFARDTSRESELRQRYQIGAKPYVFSVGTVQPRKNYPRLVESLRIVRERGYDVDLVIAGGQGWMEDPLYEMIADSGLRDQVHLIGFADDADLPGLYSCACCVAFPSLYEGFGFPVLEGMACGVPVMTSNVSSLPEVAGDAALLVDPYQVDEMAGALIKLIGDDDLRERLIKAGYTQASQFKWEYAAQQLLNIYDRILNG